MCGKCEGREKRFAKVVVIDHCLHLLLIATIASALCRVSLFFSSRGADGKQETSFFVLMVELQTQSQMSVYNVFVI